MTLAADLYFSVRSPYSYLAIGRWRELAAEYALDLSLRVVLPIAVRDPEFFKRSNPAWLRYVLTDVTRLAEYLSLPLALPDPDPIAQDLATGAIADEQPLIRPISYLEVEAARRGKGVEFADEMARMIWGGVKNWNDEIRLADAAGRAGLNLDDMRAAIAGDEAGYEKELQTNLDTLAAAGHWGVPTLVFRGEPFFGHDRIDVALWRMRRSGLTRR